jgi:hypothetical protein
LLDAGVDNLVKVIKMGEDCGFDAFRHVNASVDRYYHPGLPITALFMQGKGRR